jgi:hypothetical protein
MFREFNDVVIYDFWNNDFQIVRTGQFGKHFLEQLPDKDYLNRPFIFNCLNEGIGPLDIQLAINSIKKEGVSLNIRVIFNAIIDIDALPYKALCYPENMAKHFNFLRHISKLDVDWKNIKIRYYFISLIRRASVGRVKFAKMLLDTVKREQCIMSCGSGLDSYSLTQELINMFKPHRLPLLVDGPISISAKNQHHHTNPDFFDCLFNLVVETSSQTDSDSWTEIFITEKTFKAIAYRQIPVWFAVPGTVEEVRRLGFDTFDDIIDHSYDNITSSEVRMSKIVSTMKYFVNNYTLEQANNLRINLWSRLNNNVLLLDKLSRVHHKKKQQLLLELAK